jgi:hypothetical protein
MPKKIFNQLILPAALLSGAIIGAGIFALPYVFDKAGTIAGLFYLVVFAAVFSLIHLKYADIINATPTDHRFAGYAEIYLGKIGKILAILMTVVGTVFVLTVYLILSVSFINLLAPNLPDVYKVFIFWLFSSLAIYWKVERLAISELLVTLGMTLIIFIIFAFGLKNFSEVILSKPKFNVSYLFLPYGAILFALSGRVAIPALLGYFRRNNLPPTFSRPAIVLGTVFPAIVYLLFVIGVLNLSATVSEDSISGLVDRLPSRALELLGILGIISLWSTYIVIGRDIKKSLEHDFNFPKILIFLFVILAPLGLYFYGLGGFLRLISVTGGVFIGLEGIFIVLMRQRALQKKPLLDYLLLAIFIGGIIHALLY